MSVEDRSIDAGILDIKQINDGISPLILAHLLDEQFSQKTRNYAATTIYRLLKIQQKEQYIRDTCTYINSSTVIPFINELQQIGKFRQISHDQHDKFASKSRNLSNELFAEQIRRQQWILALLEIHGHELKETDQNQLNECLEEIKQQQYNQNGDGDYRLLNILHSTLGKLDSFTSQFNIQTEDINARNFNPESMKFDSNIFEFKEGIDAYDDYDLAYEHYTKDNE